MEFLKNLFTNDNSIIGLCGLEDQDTLTANLNRLFTNCTYTPPISPEYQRHEHLRNIFRG